jgi:hypothetical protein
MSESVVSFTRHEPSDPLLGLATEGRDRRGAHFQVRGPVRLHKVQCAARTQAARDPAHIAFSLAGRSGAAAMALAGALR